MVDQILLERILSDIHSNVRELEDASDITWEKYQSDMRSRRFVERTLHILIEACLDAAQHIISDRKMREPATYRDTFTILAENRILEPDDLKKFHPMASFRNLLLHYYERVDDAVVYDIFKRNLPDFKLFADRISAYLKKQGENYV